MHGGFNFNQKGKIMFHSNPSKAETANLISFPSLIIARSNFLLLSMQI